MTVAITVGLYDKKIYVFDMLRGKYDVIENLEKFEKYATKYPHQKNVIENK
jgi:hypothetical protein